MFSPRLTARAKLFGAFSLIRKIGPVRSGNPRIRFGMRDLNGQAPGFSGSTTISGNGHVALFLTEIPGFQNLPRYFRGVLRISSNTAISTFGLRTRYNERGDFLVSTTPAIADNVSTNVQDLFSNTQIACGITFARSSRRPMNMDF
jgi:hypothetical protein